MLNGAGRGMTMITVDAERDLAAGLRLLVAMPGPAVVRIRSQSVTSPQVHQALSWWAAEAMTPAGLALVGQREAIAALRAVAADLAGQGAVLAVFTERELPDACAHALREWEFHAPPTGMQLLAAQLRRHPGCSPSVRRPSERLPGRRVRPVGVPG